MNRQSMGLEMYEANHYIKRYSGLLVMKQQQNNTIIKYNLITGRLAKKLNVWQNWVLAKTEARGSLLVGLLIGATIWENNLATCNKFENASTPCLIMLLFGVFLSENSCSMSTGMWTQLFKATLLKIANKSIKYQWY